MYIFNIKNKSGVLIFTLYNYREGKGRNFNYNFYVNNRLNSYAFFNTDTEELKIFHYDKIKAPICDNTLLTYTLSPGEKALALVGDSCYYIDHNGEKIGYAGNRSFFHKYQVPNNMVNECEREDANFKTHNDCKENLSDEPNFEINGNKIIFKNGEIYNLDFSLQSIFGNIIVCYKYFNNTRLEGICDNRGHLLSEIKYDDIWATSHLIIKNQFIRVKLHDKFGLISVSGKEILPPVYDFVDDCDGNIAIVNHRKQLISIEDLSILYQTEYLITDIVDGWMQVVDSYYPSIRFGLLDSSGILHEFYNKEKFIYFREKEMYKALGAAFHDGLLPVFSKNRGYGYVDIDSNEIIECKYCEISDFKDGRAKVRLDCEYGYINTDGCMIVKKNEEEIVIPKIYDWAYDFNNGFFIVQKGELYGAIDENMNVILPCSLKNKEDVDLTFSKIQLKILSSNDEYYEEKYKELLPPIRFEENKRFGFKSANGRLIFPPVLSVGKFVEGMAKIFIFGKFGFINEKLELVIEPKYDGIEDFSEGLALVHQIGKGYLFINKNGEVVIKPSSKHEKIKSFYGGVATCEWNPCTPGRDNEDDEITKFKIGYKIP